MVSHFATWGFIVSTLEYRLEFALNRKKGDAGDGIVQQIYVLGRTAVGARRWCLAPAPHSPTPYRERKRLAAENSPNTSASNFPR